MNKLLKIKYILSFISIFFIYGCNSMSNQLNNNDFPFIKNKLLNDSTLSSDKKKFIIDNLYHDVYYSDLYKKINLISGGNGFIKKIPTFNKRIKKLSFKYDSILLEKLIIKENNYKLNHLISINDVKLNIDNNNNGYLMIDFDIYNYFPKKILYLVIDYGYNNANFNCKYYLNNINFNGRNNIIIPLNKKDTDFLFKNHNKFNFFFKPIIIVFKDKTSLKSSSEKFYI